MSRVVTATRRGFTLVELLVVIAIIGALVAIIIPAVQAARESARRNQCATNLHQLGTAVAQHDEAFGCLPPGLPNCVDPSKFDVVGGASAGAWCQGPAWTIALMPYLEEQNQFDLIKSCVDSLYNACDNCTQGMAPPTPFFCPSADPITGMDALTALGVANIQKANYVGNFGSETWSSYKSPATAGVFDIVDVRGLKGGPINQMLNDPSMKGSWKMGSKMGVRNVQIQDGLSRTILVSEIVGFPGKADLRGAWSLGGMGGMAFTTSRPPNTIETADLLASCEPILPMPMMPPLYQFGCDVAGPMSLGTYAAARSTHSGGVTVSMVDGSTHFIVDDIDPTVWKNLGTRNGMIPAEVPE
jgi:prepilin-type N-terminal cleavage/methylation domain-containing protein